VPHQRSRYCLLTQASYQAPSEHTLAAIVQTDSRVSGWDRFHNTFPHTVGLVRFSKVGFDYELGQALVYVRISCDAGCNSAYYVLMHRGYDGWYFTRLERAPSE